MKKTLKGNKTNLLTLRKEEKGVLRKSRADAICITTPTGIIELSNKKIDDAWNRIIRIKE